MYSNKIFEIFKNPSCAGGLQGANGIGKYIDESCGDFVKIYLKIDETQTIVEARFKTMGCVGSIVSSSVLCGLLSGLKVAEAQELTANDILEVTGEYPADKLYSVDFAIKSLNLALADYFQKLEKEDKPKRKKTKDGEKSIKENEQEEGLTDTIKEELEQENVEEDDTQPVIEENAEGEQILQVDNKMEEVEEEQVEAEESKEQDEIIEDAEPTLNQDSNIDDEYDDFFNDYDEDLFEETEGTKEKLEEKLDPVDIFLKAFGENAKTLEVKNMSNGNKSVSLGSVQEDESDKASKMVEGAKSYTPYVETKITKGNIADSNKEKQPEKKSSAKAMFDAMFEE